MFKDIEEGQTHSFDDGCNPPHEMQEKTYTHSEVTALLNRVIGEDVDEETMDVNVLYYRVGGNLARKESRKRAKEEGFNL